MKTIVFDIETIADPEAIQFLEEPTPNGTYKDPAKIAADIAAKREKARAEMGLNPWMSLIACFCWQDSTGAKGSIALEDETKEETLLSKAWNILRTGQKFVTFNGHSFDIPMLMAHSVIRSVNPGMTIPNRKYDLSSHFDVRMALVNWDPYAKGKLDFFLRRFGLAPKTEGLDGSMVQGLWDAGKKEEITAYCAQDVSATWELYQKVRSVYAGYNPEDI